MEKSGVLKHKGCDISETRTDRGKVTMRAYRNLPTLIPKKPTASPSQRLGFAPHPKLQSLLSEERVKLWTSNVASTFTGSIRTKAHQKGGEKGAWAYPWTAQSFKVRLLSQERVKQQTSNLTGTCTGSIRTKPH